MNLHDIVAQNKVFSIRGSEDIFTAIGKIIKNAQEWEQAYKRLAKLYDISIDEAKIDIASLNKLNNCLKKERKIKPKDYKNLKTVIDMRNYINHEFFLKDFSKPYNEIEDKLNEVHNYIFEANDVVRNLIDIKQGVGCLRPTIFDEV